MLYGLGCDIHNKSAIKKIYQLKGIKKPKPLSIIFADFKHITEYAIIPNSTFRLMKKLVPGPFTFIVKATNKIPKMLATKQRNVGIRIPDSLFCREIVNTAKCPIISTSLKDGEEIPLSDPELIYEKFHSSISMVFSEGATFSDPSTVIDTTGTNFTILRQGKGIVDL